MWLIVVAIVISVIVWLSGPGPVIAPARCTQRLPEDVFENNGASVSRWTARYD